MPDTPTDLLAEVQAIKKHLERMDRRDRLRTIGGFFKGIIAFTYLFIFLYSAWYIAAYGGELIGMVAEEAAKQASGFSNFPNIVIPASTGSTNGSLNDLLRQYMQNGSR